MRDWKRSQFLGRKNLLDLYLQTAGRTEVPPEWHTWCLLSLVAAAVGDRVWHHRVAWVPTFPNIYVFLIGPSGSGKGTALSYARQFAPAQTNTHVGMANAKGILADMGKQQNHRSRKLPNRYWLIQPELASNIGTGPKAFEFIKNMTDWYTPVGDQYDESTRISGRTRNRTPIINWLVGTTPDWLLECVSTRDMASGFFGRVFTVRGGETMRYRVVDPMQHQPKDYMEATETIRNYLNSLGDLFGEYKFNEEAQAAELRWHKQRRKPRNRNLMPMYEREQELITKVAMLFSLCRDQRLEVDLWAYNQAKRVVGNVKRNLPDLVKNVEIVNETNCERHMLFHVRQLTSNGDWSTWLNVRKAADGRGYTWDEMRESCMELARKGRIKRRSIGGGHKFRVIDEELGIARQKKGKQEVLSIAEYRRRYPHHTQALIDKAKSRV